MAGTITNNTLVMRYAAGTYRFDKIDINADEAEMHQLALALNKFQLEQPPTKISCIVTTQII